MRCRAAALALCFGAWACVDFGETPAPDASSPDASSSDASSSDADSADAETIGPDAGESCVEGPADAALAENTIDIVRFSVDPLELRIAAGTVLALTNTDTRNHRMLSGTPEEPIEPAQGGFNTGALEPGGSYGHRFCEPRTLLYYCSTHPGVMNGYRIVIE